MFYTGKYNCKKCGQPLIKSKKYRISLFCLDGYDVTTDLCIGCNATESVLKRLKEKSNISVSDLKKLPRYLVFDPSDNNLDEFFYGITFQRMVNDYNMQITQQRK